MSLRPPIQFLLNIGDPLGHQSTTVIVIGISLQVELNFLVNFEVLGQLGVNLSVVNLRLVQVTSVVTSSS